LLQGDDCDGIRLSGFRAPGAAPHPAMYTMSPS
jgi:hypothetical protein